MCDKEEKDMTTAETRKIISIKSIPSTRSHPISNAIQEVDLIERKVLPKKSARSFLKDLREEN